MGLDMTLYVYDPEIAREIREGYTREGNNWSTVAVSTGRDWREEGGIFGDPLTRYFINRLGLGEPSLCDLTDTNGNPIDLSGFGFSIMSSTADDIARAYDHMDEYITEASEQEGLIAYWRNAYHIHAWFDRLFKAAINDDDVTIPSGCHLGLPAAVLEALLVDCYEVVYTAIETGDENNCIADEAVALMNEKFPFLDAISEEDDLGEYIQGYLDDILQTALFLYHLLSLPGADEALYTYSPWY